MRVARLPEAHGWCVRHVTPIHIVFTERREGLINAEPQWAVDQAENSDRSICIRSGARLNARRKPHVKCRRDVSIWGRRRARTSNHCLTPVHTGKRLPQLFCPMQPCYIGHTAPLTASAVGNNTTLQGRQDAALPKQITNTPWSNDRSRAQRSASIY